MQSVNRQTISPLIVTIKLSKKNQFIIAEKHKQFTNQDNEKVQLIDNPTLLFVNLNKNN